MPEIIRAKWADIPTGAFAWVRVNPRELASIAERLGLPIVEWGDGLHVLAHGAIYWCPLDEAAEEGLLGLERVRELGLPIDQARERLLKEVQREAQRLLEGVVARARERAGEG